MATLHEATKMYVTFGAATWPLERIGAPKMQGTKIPTTALNATLAADGHIYTTFDVGYIVEHQDFDIQIYYKGASDIPAIGDSDTLTIFDNDDTELLAGTAKVVALTPPEGAKSEVKFITITFCFSGEVTGDLITGP